MIKTLNWGYERIRKRNKTKPNCEKIFTSLETFSLSIRYAA